MSRNYCETPMERKGYKIGLLKYNFSEKLKDLKFFAIFITCALNETSLFVVYRTSLK